MEEKVFCCILDDWEHCEDLYNDPIGKQNFIWGSPKSKNIDYKVEHPVFSTDENGKPNISYIDQFPEPSSYGARSFFTTVFLNALENSKRHMAFKLPPGYSIFSNNHFLLHGRKAFQPSPNMTESS